MISRSLLRQSALLRASSTRPFTSPRVAQPLSRLRAAAPSIAARRGYSAEAEAEKAPEAQKKDDDKAAAKTPEDELKAKLEAKEKEAVDMKDKYLRSVADFRNLQERTRRDMEAARDFAITRFAKDLVDSVDNLDRALSAVPAAALAGEGAGSKELKDLHGGLKMTEQVLLKALASHGLVRFDPSVAEEGKEGGERFDPNKHDAAFMAKVDGKEDGTVFQTMQKGYLLNGRVIRAAKVGVVKNS